ncbi:snoRNP complex protein [Pichia kluyveri]|uniref:Nucleolar protein 56 n=1 Tax=Pichia kluyveri TaxID=36015 RepID=A0AAV5R2X6_PICKL|nr:snoRNP complex protein [Pichia kluyveri]
MAGVDFLLFEQPTGYAIFKVKLQNDNIGSRLKDVQESINDLSNFSKLVELQSFAPFKGAAQALENANDISEGLVSDYLKSIIELNIPKSKSKDQINLGISDKQLGPSIKEFFPYIDCISNEIVQDLLRGIRFHGEKLLKNLNEGDLERAQLGLGHAYSRSKVKFSVQKNDNHIIQSIALLDQLDKDINTYSMRVKEWYGWHFPELAKIVNDNHTYAKLVLNIKDKSNLSDDNLHEIASLVNDDSNLAQKIIDMAKISMGQDISNDDMENILTFAKRTDSISNYRINLFNYLNDKMHLVAPNLSELIGEVVGARLISHAGSLTNLSKQAASTVQILGAEKALFRALKTKGNTPKYGLIYHSSFIGKASPKNKGRISRYLANKCSIASRIDNFSDDANNIFGKVLKQQVEDRLEFYNTGKSPMKNSDAIKEALKLNGGASDLIESSNKEEKKDKKEKSEKKEKKDKKEKKEKKEKKDKKEKKRKAEDEGEEKKDKKKKKKSKD